MKKMNNIVIVALCVAILGVLLTGCGKVSSDNKKAVKNENTAFSEVLEAEELEAEQPEVVKDETILKCEEIEKEIIEEYGDFEMFSTSELIGEMLENRMNGDKVIVERTKGIVLDDELNGSAEDHYISYRSVEGAQPGDEIITYLVYNPATSYIDDIIERYDVIIK